MEKFLFIIREDLNVLKDYTEEHRHQGMLEMSRWVESLAESWSYGGGEPLAITGRYVNKESVLSDGPFIEAKEGVSGYIVIEADNLDAAASFAQTCPLVLRGTMAIEVRPMLGPCQG
ncbi:MAG TPA: YciI family protein [Puia sp.]|nr:YciI family protein [Puia sp.]